MGRHPWGGARPNPGLLTPSYPFFLYTTSNLHTVDSDASSHPLGTWSLNKRRIGVARTPQPQASRAGCLPLSFPRRRENWPEPQQFLFQGRASWCLLTPSTSLAGNRVQSQHQPQQGQSHPGSCWSHRESQVSEGIGSEGPRESPDSTALESALEPGIWSGLWNLELVFVCLFVSQKRGFYLLTPCRWNPWAPLQTPD